MRKERNEPTKIPVPRARMIVVSDSGFSEQKLRRLFPDQVLEENFIKEVKIFFTFSK